MESVRYEVHLGTDFSREAFADAFEQFRRLYHVRPHRVLGSPNMLARYCEIFERSVDVAHLHSSRLSFEGVPLVAAIAVPGTIAFEGEVDEERMGDW
jgi:hypothetical protein